MKEYILENDELKVEVLDFGGTIKNIYYHDEPMVIAYKQNEDYEVYTDPCLNAIIGPNAGRIADGKCLEYTLSHKPGKHHLHGGNSNIARKTFEVTQVNNNKLHLHLETKHDEDGYPEGIFTYDIDYEIIGNSLILNYVATPPKPLPMSLTNHLYFNLNNNDFLESELEVHASKRVVVDETSKPAKIIDIEPNSVFDLKDLKKLKAMQALSHPEFKHTRGYDHPFILDDGYLHLENLKYSLNIKTDQKAVVVYSANYFNSDLPLDHNIIPKPYCALALECQDIPNYINLGFDRLYDKEHPYTQTTKYTFKKR